MLFELQGWMLREGTLCVGDSILHQNLESEVIGEKH